MLSMDFVGRDENAGYAGFHLSLTWRVLVRGHLRWLGIEESKGIQSSSLFLSGNHLPPI